ncbi:hypothetical protein V8F33_000873 [Rhypophila sp. PSN 637]
MYIIIHDARPSLKCSFQTVRLETDRWRRLCVDGLRLGGRYVSSRNNTVNNQSYGTYLDFRDSPDLANPQIASHRWLRLVRPKMHNLSACDHVPGSSRDRSAMVILASPDTRLGDHSKEKSASLLRQLSRALAKPLLWGLWKRCPCMGLLFEYQDLVKAGRVKRLVPSTEKTRPQISGQKLCQEKTLNSRETGRCLEVVTRSGEKGATPQRKSEERLLQSEMVAATPFKTANRVLFIFQDPCLHSLD